MVIGAEYAREPFPAGEKMAGSFAQFESEAAPSAQLISRLALPIFPISRDGRASDLAVVT